ncbi:MAG: heme ABC exporter ATP-binding protein CcmA [Alphaproteobacteria bacterium]
MNRASRHGLAAEDLVCVRGERLVFRDLHFALGPGEALVLTGPNGSGKSSLLRLLAGLLAPAAGRIFWNGADVADDAEAHRARLAYVGHHNAVKRQLTVAENLTFWAGLYGGAGAAARAAAALDRLGIDHLADVPAALLSAGQHRRLALARIAAAPAPLWLLDEPTVTLDESSVGVVETLIAEQRAGGGLVVVATHTGLEVPGARRIELGGAS